MSDWLKWANEPKPELKKIPKTKSQTKTQTPYDRMPEHVKRAWNRIRDSMLSVWKKSKWSDRYDQILNLIDWIEKGK